MNQLELRELGEVDVFLDRQDVFTRLSELVHQFDTSTSQYGESDLQNILCNLRGYGNA